MRGNFKSQVGRLFQEIDGTGTSKFADKQQVREELKNQGQAATSSAIGAKTAVHANSTNEGYFVRCVELAQWARDYDGTKDVEQITAAHVTAFLAEKIDAGVSLSHWSGYAAAFSKMEQAQEKFSLSVRNEEKSFGYRAVTEALRPEAHAELHRFRGTRNYDNPSALVSAMKSDIGRLISAIQHESGLRIAAATHVTAGQIMGMITDRYTGEQRGQLQYVCKGGAVLTATVSHRTYAAVQSHVLSNGELRMDHKGYRAELKAAAMATGQGFNSSHGLRWSYAQERFAELMSRGIGYERVLGVVSTEMGHHRISITEHYVFGK
jgi:integrase